MRRNEKVRSRPTSVHSRGMDTEMGDAEYFGGGTQEGHKSQAGDAISKVSGFTM
jgi:hypothetical protein